MALLKIENLSKVYGTGDRALKNFDLKVKKGEFVSCIGPSGAGKSTMIRCINRLVEPDTGSKIYLEDENIVKLNNKELRRTRRKIGMIFQEFNLVERLTVMENLLSGRLGYTGTLKSILRVFSDTDEVNAYELLERVGMRDMVNKKATELSGGQRQRVGIARALMQEPKLLLADEPTSSLDPEIGRRIINLIRNITKERNNTVLVNIHDVDLALEYSDRVVGLREGEKIFDGSPSEVDQVVRDRIYRGYEENGQN